MNDLLDSFPKLCWSTNNNMCVQSICASKRMLNSVVKSQLFSSFLLSPAFLLNRSDRQSGSDFRNVPPVGGCL